MSSRAAAAPARWSPIRALSWESMRLSWRPVLGVTLAGCAMAALYRRMLEPLGSQRDSLVFTSMLFTLLVVLPLTLLTCRTDGIALGFESRLFRLPVPTWRLVIGRLATAWLAVATMQSAVALFLRLLYGDRWPLLGPALLQGGIVVWVLALTWTFGRRPYLIAPFGLAVLLATQGWLRGRLAEDPLWRRLEAVDVAILLGATALGVCLAIVGVRRDRREGAGRAPSRLRIAARLREAAGAGEAMDAVTARVERDAFASPLRAQLWMEWREKGRLLTVWALIGFVWQLALGSIRGPSARAAWSDALTYLLLAAVALPTVSGFLHGRFDLSSRRPEIDRFRATRPIDDARLAWTLLFAAGRAAVFAITGVLLALGCLAVGLLLFGDAAPIEATRAMLAAPLSRLVLLDRLLVGLLALLALWSGMGLVATAALTGRNAVVGAVAGAPLALALVGILASRLLGRDLFAAALPAVPVLVLLAPPLSLVVVVTAVALRLLTVRGAARLLGAAGFVSVLVAVRQRFLAEGLLGTPELAPQTAAAAVAVVAVAILPIAGAPLAVRWNRHR